MEIHHLGRLCLLVTALFSLDLYTKFSQICLTFNAAKYCSYFFKFLLGKSPETGSLYHAEFVTGIALFFAFSVGFKILNFSFRPWSHLRRRACLNSDVCDLMERPSSAFENGSVKGSEYSDSEGSYPEDRVFDEMSLREFSLSNDIRDPMELFGRPDSPVENGHLVSNGNRARSIGGSGDSETEELFLEDQLSDETLRELVRSERRRAEAALMELEKERSSATTAAEEAMSMILRLQREKSSIEIEAKQYRRLAEEKQRHDQGLIGFLRSVIMEQERDLDGLEGELRLCRRRLSSCNCGDCSDGTDDLEKGAEEGDARRHENGDFAMEDSFDEEFEDGLISSLEFDSWAL
ncbi:uncharacterized protein LOC116197807 [Punica granatum]|uniref:GTD-binding domain-containing protein n=2 Tax=Punica granatum TaxID=22663 RepID=A0A218VTL4_PUNGR|nr:uncharacterized protein LOC116197807 [Punica granatum]OWM63673.1 hypothetical protein CDL15_Pgr008216 [Punica granatum]PKI38793.1 hypothetical protein CRG98_040834 [Punica granatum]